MFADSPDSMFEAPRVLHEPGDLVWVEWSRGSEGRVLSCAISVRACTARLLLERKGYGSSRNSLLRPRREGEGG